MSDLRNCFSKFFNLLDNVDISVLFKRSGGPKRKNLLRDFHFLMISLTDPFSQVIPSALGDKIRIPVQSCNIRCKYN